MISRRSSRSSSNAGAGSTGRCTPSRGLCRRLCMATAARSWPWTSTARWPGRSMTGWESPRRPWSRFPATSRATWVPPVPWRRLPPAASRASTVWPACGDSRRRSAGTPPIPRRSPTRSASCSPTGRGESAARSCTWTADSTRWGLRSSADSLPRVLLAIDVGNTQTHVGMWGGDDLVEHWRVHTDRDATADTLATNLSNLLALRDLGFRDVEAAIVSYVVPVLGHEYEGLSERYLDGAMQLVGPRLKTGMAIRTDNPHEVGADRLVNAVAAYERVGG